MTSKVSGGKRLTQLAHELILSAVTPGETVLDATMGNGHDTLFLARLVGEHGLVHAFDVQDQALAMTQKRLEEAFIPASQVCLHKLSHEHLDTPVGSQSIGAFMFNLGYLPGSSKEWVTRPETTLTALAKAISLLRPGGLGTVLAYRGHPGGMEEARSVLSYLRGQSDRLGLRCFESSNSLPTSPCLYVIDRL